VSYPGRPAAKPVAELIGTALDPLMRKRGLARAELLSWWPDIVGAAYAGHTAPEKIRWPRDGGAGTLFVACDPALALQFSYEADRVRERLNGFFGYAAIGSVRIVQKRVVETPEEPARAPVPAEIPQPLEEKLREVEGPLRDSLKELARSILARP
jgi:hypothetical protein